MEENQIEEMRKIILTYIHRAIDDGLVTWSDFAGYVAKHLIEQGYGNQSRWISVEESLPDCTLIRDIFGRPGDYVSDKVLVCVKSDEVDGVHYYVSTDIRIGRTLEDAHWLMSCGYGGTAVYSQTITHWMPLPRPPKGGVE